VHELESALSRLRWELAKAKLDPEILTKAARGAFLSLAGPRSGKVMRNILSVARIWAALCASNLRIATVSQPVNHVELADNYLGGMLP